MFTVIRTKNILFFLLLTLLVLCLFSTLGCGKPEYWEEQYNRVKKQRDTTRNDLRDTITQRDKPVMISEIP